MRVCFINECGAVRVCNRHLSVHVTADVGKINKFSQPDESHI